MVFPKEQVFRFGPFTFSRARGLYRGRERTPLPHAERQIIKHLVDRAGDIVRKEELVAAVWPGIVVSPNTLNVHVHRLRRRLGDDTHELIKSCSKIGYTLNATPVPQRVAPIAQKPLPGDRSRFLRDVTVPDGTMMQPDETFEKTWEIQNIGSLAWRGRILRRIGACSGMGLIVSDPETPVPGTLSGRVCLIRMSLRAPAQPGSTIAAWKMYPDAKSTKPCFPRADPIYVHITVLAPTD